MTSLTDIEAHAHNLQLEIDAARRSTYVRMESIRREAHERGMLEMRNLQAFIAPLQRERDALLEAITAYKTETVAPIFQAMDYAVPADHRPGGRAT